jgi:hypothetical protein|tara:strand:- start:4066 stop:4326 length:261 start_codon:yes stop_codon:yes gene_type:complete
MKEYSEDVCIIGNEYTIGFSHGEVIKRVVYLGDKMSGGKVMRCFETKKQRKLVLANPSYTAFILEEDMDELNSITSEQAQESWKGD